MDADRISRTLVRIAHENRVKIEVGFVMRTLPVIQRLRQMLTSGEIGVLQEIRARGKEDRRAGGEDMAVLGPHLFDLMRMFAGDPRWVFAHVTEDSQELDRKRVRVPTEPIGPVAGNQIAAMFACERGSDIRGDILRILPISNAASCICLWQMAEICERPRW